MRTTGEPDGRVKVTRLTVRVLTGVDRKPPVPDPVPGWVVDEASELPPRGIVRTTGELDANVTVTRLADGLWVGTTRVDAPLTRGMVTTKGEPEDGVTVRTE